MNRSVSNRFFLSVALPLAFSVGCASNAKKITVRPEAVGAYRFTEHVAEGTDLDGIFVVEADSVSIEATPGPCRYERERSNALSIVYTCADVTYGFDRSDPVVRASYSVPVRLQKTRSVCVRYAVTSSGQSVCAQYQNETYFVDSRRSGPLRPQRISDDDPNHPQ